MNDKWQDSWDEWQDTAPFVASEYLQFQNGVYGNSPNSYPSIADNAERRGAMLNLKFRPIEIGVTPPPQCFLGVKSSRKLGLRVGPSGDSGHRTTRKNKKKRKFPAPGAVWGGNCEPQNIILAFPQLFRIRHFSDRTPTDRKSQFSGILAFCGPRPQEKF